MPTLLICFLLCLSASAQFVPSAYATTAPSITLTKMEGSPKQTFRVKGMQFTPSTQVAVYFQSQLVTSTITSSTGAFTSAPVTVPTDPQGTYTVSARQTSSGAQAQASFNIIPGFAHLTPPDHSNISPKDPLCAQFGIQQSPEKVSVGIAGVPASVAYDVRWRYENGGSSSVIVNGTTTASGTFSTSFRVPAEPAGFYTLIVEINSGSIGLDAIYDSGVYTCFSNTQPGDRSIHYTWDGVGWDPNSTVSFNFNGSQIWQTPADAHGSFGIINFTQTPCPAPGTYPGTITGTADNQPVSIPFNPPVTVGSGC